MRVGQPLGECAGGCGLLLALVLITQFSLLTWSQGVHHSSPCPQGAIATRDARGTDGPDTNICGSVQVLGSPVVHSQSGFLLLKDLKLV